MSHQDSSWNVHYWHGSASDFHHETLESRRAVWLCSVTKPALILGSTQTADLVDGDCARAAGIEVAKRRSGGGLVYVHPNDSTWIDITISRDDALWKDDVSQSMLWLGEMWSAALAPWINTVCYGGQFDAGPDGRSICFASTSPGEVFSDHAKVVGISQRRTREGARFQCVMYTRWQPTEWVHCLTDADLAHRVCALPVAVVEAPTRAIVEAVHAQLMLL